MVWHWRVESIWIGKQVVHGRFKLVGLELGGGGSLPEPGWVDLVTFPTFSSKPTALFERVDPESRPVT